MASQPQHSLAGSADLVFTDDLTGLRNRRFLYQVFGDGWGEITDQGDELSLAIVDLDYFKQVNDTHGHLTGDLILAGTAALIEGFLAAADCAIRYGGDEFVLLLPNRSKEEARALLEALRRAMASNEFVSKEEQQPLEVLLSFSIGLATYPEDGTCGEELMAAADKALYASKRSGRNCVTLSGEIPVGLEDEIDRFRTFPAKAIVGRQDLIEVLTGACELVNRGTGTWTAFQGPAGVGKTRLLHEALSLGLESGVSCVLISAAEDLSNQPFSGIVRLLAELGSRDPKSLESLKDLADPDLLQFLGFHFPEAFAETAGVEDGLQAPPPFEATHAALLAALGALCEEGRWLFLIDNAAHLDSHSAELLREALEVERLPIGVVSAVRSGEESTDLPGRAFSRSVERRPWFDVQQVKPLSRQSTGLLISVLLPNNHAPAVFGDLVFEVTNGNPLFVEEVLRIGIARNKITRRGEEWFVQPQSRDDFPATLEEAIRQRMSLLDAEVEQLISRASAIGTSFTSEILQALLGKNEGEVLGFLDKARDQGYVEGGQFGESGEIRFASSSLRDLAYREMAPTEKIRAHREIGKIEEHRAGTRVGALASRLAYHFERGEVYEKARSYLEAAQAAAPEVVVAGSWNEAEVPTHRRRRITDAAVPLPKEAWTSLDGALRALAQATKSLWMYPKGSPIAKEAFRDLHRQLERLLEHAHVISFAAVERTLVVNGVPYPSRRQQFLVRGLLDQIKTRELRGFTIRRGLTEKEATFLVSQLASDEPIVRDPEAWEALLDSKRITNVDFGDRVYVPAEGLTGAPIDPSTIDSSPSGVIRVVSATEMEGMIRQGSDGELSNTKGEPEMLPGGETGIALSPKDLELLVEGLKAHQSMRQEFEVLVPALVGLLKHLLESSDDETRLRHHHLIEAFEVEGEQSEGETTDSLNPDDLLKQMESDGNLDEKRSLLRPAERKFEALVQAKDYSGARTVLRFIRQCQSFDDGEADLAIDSRDALATIAAGGTIQMLLADLGEGTESPDREALALLGEIGSDAGPILVTYLRETDDLRTRRILANLIKEIGGESLEAALATVTHGDNPAVARRVISVLDCLSPDLPNDLSEAVQVRNPGVLGEAIKILQSQERTIQLRVIDSLLESASPEMVCRGVYYLSEWNLSEADEKLLALLRASENYEIMTAIAAVMARRRLIEAVPVLGDLLRKRQVIKMIPYYSKELRRELARAIAAIGSLEALEVLAEFTRDVDHEVRRIARGMPPPSGA